MFGFGRKKAAAERERLAPQLAPPAEPEAAAAVPAVRNGRDIGDWEELAQMINTAAASFAGPRVTEDSAMRTAAVFACVRLISGSIAGLPLPVFKLDAEGQRQKVDHPFGWLLNNEPNALMTAATYWKYVVTAELLGGDQISMIGRTKGGEPYELVPVDPKAVFVDLKGGRFQYYIQGPEGEYIGLDQDDVLHVPGEGFSLARRRGMSVISYAAKQAIGIALATEEYSARFFSNGARPDIVLRYPGEMGDNEVKRVREYWLSKHQGLANAHLPGVLTEGGDIKELTLSAEDSQLLQSRMFQVIDIARAFGVPPVMIGESEKTSSWGSGVEQMALWFVKFTLRNHLTKMEQEINRKIFRTGRFFCEFNVEGLLRGDSKSRSEFIRNAIGGSSGPGYMTVNEARRLENLPPIPGGDTLYSPAAPAKPEKAHA